MNLIKTLLIKSLSLCLIVAPAIGYAKQAQTYFECGPWLYTGVNQQTGDHQQYTRHKTEYTQIAVANPGCCLKVLCPGQTQPTATVKGAGVTGFTRTWSRSGKLSFAFVWNILTGSPWEATNADSKTENHTTTGEVTATASCGLTAYVWQSKVTVEKYESNRSGNRNEVRTEKIETFGVKEVTVKTGQTVDPCTDKLSGEDACVTLTIEPEPACTVAD